MSTALDITCFIMGICLPNRLEWLKQNVESVDNQKFPFKRKIISVDQFDGHILPDQYKNFFESSGWEVFIDNAKSRSTCMSRILSEINTKYIFYNEDDVLVKLPYPEDIDKVFNTKIDDRECGMISLTLGGGGYDWPRKIWGDLFFAYDNTILKNDSYRIFRRVEEYSDGFFFEFPGLFVRADLFRDCHNKALKSMLHIETGLTKAYFESEQHKKFYKCSLSRVNILDVLNADDMKINSNWTTPSGKKLRLLNNLDSNQGNGLGSANTQGYI